MREYEFHFLEEAVIKKISEATKNFLGSDIEPKQFIEELKKLLPVSKTDRSTHKSRVEGLYFVNEFLFQEVLDKGKKKVGEDWNHNKIVSQAKLRPFSHYHYLSGSHEPVVNVRTRDDYLNDPATAMMKLEDDIIALGLLYRKLSAVEV